MRFLRDAGLHCGMRSATTKNNWSRGGLGVATANRDGYDRIIVITDGQWHYSDTTTVQGYGEGYCKLSRRRHSRSRRT